MRSIAAARGTRSPQGPRPGVRAVAAVGTATALVAGLLAITAVPASAAGQRGTTKVRGTVERTTIDNFAAPLPEGQDVLTFVRDGDTMLQVPEAALAHVPTGSTVDLSLASTAGTRVTAQGALVSDLGADAQDPQAGVDVAAVEVVSTPTDSQSATGAGVTTTSTAVAAGTAVHQVYVVVAKPAGGSTPSVAPASVASTISNGVSSYWSTVTGGRVAFAATYYPTVLSTTNVPCSNGGVSTSSAFWNEVATRTGWTAGSGKHLVVYFAGFSACGGIAGLGTIGDGLGSGGVTWTNGYNNVGVIGHELGHNLGLGHSQELDCTASGARVIDAAPSACSARSYWDVNDIMALSWNYQGYLNASHLRTLGLLDGSSQAQPTSSGTVTLAPLESGSGLRVLTLSDGATRYVVEYRRPIGLDSWMATVSGWGSPGVTVRKEFDLAQAGTGAFDAIESYVLDGDPATDDAGLGRISTALPTGAWIDLADGRLGLRVVAAADGGATVDYRLGDASADPRYVAAPKPVVSNPVAALATGTIRPRSTSAVVPVRWSWTVATPSLDPAAAATVSSAAAVVATGTGAGSWLAIGYAAKATAADGSVVSAYTRSVARYTTEGASTRTRFTTGWTVRATSTAVGGKLRTTARKGASVTTKVAGRSIGVVLAAGSRYGKVGIYLDGRLVKVLNQKSSRTSVRVAWTARFAGTGTHTVRVVNLTGGTYGGLGFDGTVAVA